MKLFILSIMCLITLIDPTSVMAQRERNYIYLLDCTKSMTGYNSSPDIWEPTKKYLKKELQKHVEGTTLHVVPFQGKVLPAFSFDANDLIWEKIEADLQKHVKNVTNTNICDAWDITDRLIDVHKDNYIILLTDGKDNVKGMNAVAQKLKAWCGKYPHSWAFYVQLTEAAVDQRVIKIIDLCDNEFVIDGSKGIPVHGNIDNAFIYANTLNLDKTHKIGFSAAGNYPVKAICSDKYFDVQVINGRIVDGLVSVKIMVKAGKTIAEINSKLPDTYNFTFDINSDVVKILNPTITVQMTNKPERSLEIISEEVNMGEANWYDSFLFSNASIPDTLSIDLKSVFNDEAKKDSSIIQFQIKDSDRMNDFQLFYNGKLLEKGIFTINSKDKTPSILSIVFNPRAKEGPRYLTIEAYSKQKLDNINDKPVNLYQLSLRSKYVVNWNPLKTFLMWLSIIIVTILLLWFLLIRRIVFPTFSFDNLQVIYSDGESKKGREDCSLCGARKIICSVSPKTQGYLNKLFFGRIEYLTNPFWKSTVVMKPCGSDGIAINEDIQAGDVAVFRMTSMITPQNGPRRPFVVKRAHTDLIANISIG